MTVKSHFIGVFFFLDPGVWFLYLEIDTFVAQKHVLLL